VLPALLLRSGRAYVVLARRGSRSGSGSRPDLRIGRRRSGYPEIDLSAKVAALQAGQDRRAV